jgi:2-polyprenyl-3-methyl-5-hydroxy-6-metoxy-1,4-benzoquinol methylase
MVMGSNLGARYDDIADWYAMWVRTKSWAHAIIAEHAYSLTGDVDGQVLLDVACGEGMFSRLLVASGANVAGIDISPRMIELARSEPPGSLQSPAFDVDDAQTLATLESGRFDGAICMMALMDIPDLEAVYRAVRRVVKDGGWFVIAITHPCFDAPHATWEKDVEMPARIISHYLEEKNWRSRFAGGVRGRVGAWHRTLSSYLNVAVETGWTLDRLVEPAGGPEGQNPHIPRLVMIRFRA